MENNKEETHLLNENSQRSHKFNDMWNVSKESLNTLVYILIGVNVLVAVCFTLKSFPFTPVQLHVGLTVVGYQLLMGHGILALANYNGWSASLTYARRRQAHWILQLLGSILAIAGSIIMIREKDDSPTTTHGKFGIASLLCTYVSLLSGVSSLYRFGVRRLLPAEAIKIGHLVIGTLAFGLSSISLVYGFLKESFTNWSSIEFSYILIIVTLIYTVIITSRPAYMITKKMYRFAKYKTN